MLESCLNTASGFVVALLIWTFIVIPLFGFNGLTWGDNLGITAIFTVSSILRGYVWRRIFNWIMVNRGQIWHRITQLVA